jgi:hypothetical protein
MRWLLRMRLRIWLWRLLRTPGLFRPAGVCLLLTTPLRPQLGLWPELAWRRVACRRLARCRLAWSRLAWSRLARCRLAWSWLARRRLAGWASMVGLLSHQTKDLTPQISSPESPAGRLATIPPGSQAATALLVLGAAYSPND